MRCKSARSKVVLADPLDAWRDALQVFRPHRYRARIFDDDTESPFQLAIRCESRPLTHDSVPILFPPNLSTGFMTRTDIEQS